MVVPFFPIWISDEGKHLGSKSINCMVLSLGLLTQSILGSIIKNLIFIK